MRVLIDACLPVQLKAHLPLAEVRTARDLGWLTCPYLTCRLGLRLRRGRKIAGHRSRPGSEPVFEVGRIPVVLARAHGAGALVVEGDDADEFVKVDAAVAGTGYACIRGVITRERHRHGRIARGIGREAILIVRRIDAVAAGALRAATAVVQLDHAREFAQAEPEDEET